MPFDNNQIAYQMNVTFGPVETDNYNQHVKAFVNDEPVGRVKIRKNRLVFRSPRNPQTNTVRTPTLNPTEFPLEELLLNRYVLEQLIPVVIRNYLNNHSYLFDVLPK